MNLVTVTCLQDLHQMILQSHSIDRFIDNPCTHWVIIEDVAPDVDFFKEKLSPFYTRHKLNLVTADTLFSTVPLELKTNSGWLRQQVLKFLIAPNIETATYLILDSKNFFINYSNLKNWPISIGNNLTMSFLPYKSYRSLLKWFSTEYNLSFLFACCEPVTPFRVNTNIVKKLNSLDLIKIFNKNKFDTSEFILYCAFSQSQGFDFPSGPTCCKTFWSADEISKVTFDFLDDIKQWPNLQCLGVHRSAIPENASEIETFVNWLEVQGLDRQILLQTFDRNRCLELFPNKVNQPLTLK